VLDMSDVDRDKLAAVKEITSEVYTEGRGEEAQRVKRTKFSLYDKRAALMDLAKLEGHIVDRQQLSGPNGGPIPLVSAHVIAAEELTPETRAKLRAALESMKEVEDD
jgi:predicted ATP-grasp superfamily ATP-dependent carboligase